MDKIIKIKQQTSVSRDIENLDRLCELFEARKKIRKANKQLDKAEKILRSNGGVQDMYSLIEIQDNRKDLLIAWQEIENEIEWLF